MSTPGGYAGRWLNVDLSRGKLTDEPLDEPLMRAFIGGYGLGAKLLYEMIPRGADPLGPENVLGLVTGPLTGTPALMSTRYTTVGKSPLTGGWGDANSGGEFAPALKFSGYDAVFFSGISPQPVYLLIDNGNAQLLPASDLWGLDAVQTEEILRARHGADARVACIGPAGERLARIACIMNDKGRAAGRSGLGAVMGSKRIKAVVARGDMVPAVAQPDRMKELRKKYLAPFRADPNAEIMRTFGTPGYMATLLQMGRSPIKNWRGNYPMDFPHPETLDGPAVMAYTYRKYSCWHCNQGCGTILEWESDGQKLRDHKPEYETLALTGSNLGIEDVKVVMEMNLLCNQMGLDTISAGSAVGFTMECFERGILTEADLDGLSMRWGDGAAAITLIKRIAARQGIGDLLAEGVMRAAQSIGHGSESFAIHSGGQELPAHDPRQTQDFGLLYQVSPTPGRHTQGGVDAFKMPAEHLALFGIDPELKTKDPVRFHAWTFAKDNQWTNTLNATGLCLNGGGIMGPRQVPDFLSAVTGWDIAMPEVLEIGERIEDMRLIFGLREGYNLLETRVAPRTMGHPPQPAGPTAGVVVDVADLRDAYLEVMDWDPVTGMPSQARLAALGLAELVQT